MNKLPRILVVDDNDRNRLVVRRILNGLDIELVEATNGFDALALALSETFALILLDVQMPQMDGFEVCEQLRADARTAQVPVIFLTAAYKEHADKMHGYLVGATDYLAKPIDDRILKAKVLVFLQLSQQQQLLAHNNQALARSNAELEQFAYVVSHDLRQPLRMITSYMQLLERRLADKLDDDTKKMMGFAVDGAVRMDQMLLALLEYSRVGRKGEPQQKIDSRLVLDEVLHFLGPQISNSQAEVKISGQWPVILVSPNEFSRLLQNLLSNALKYHFPNQKPQITVGVERLESEWCFCVRDQGIGIDPTQFDRLFLVFQRLHQREQYEGNGIGLAVARKIIERHGGLLWVESAGLGQGCCFYFTLPIVEDKSCESS